MKRIAAVVVFICLLLITGCSDKDNRISEIKKRGVLCVGVKSDVPRFGHLNNETNEYEGLEIDISKALAKDILGDESAVSFVPVTAQTRDQLLNSREIDLIIATFTITEERKKTHNFSAPYYTDEIGFLVKKESGIQSATDMNGKTVGAANSSTALKELESGEIATHSTFTHKGFANYPDLKSALTTGKIDVFAADKSILYGYLDNNTVLLEEGFKPQPYGIATRLDDKEFAKYIDEQLQKMKNNGTLGEILNTWIQ